MDTGPSDSAETRQLLQRVRCGDDGAFDQLFARHRAFLRQIVELRMDPKLGRRIDASDVVQEAHIEAVRRLEGYLEQPTMPFRVWLRQITYDRLLMARRRHVSAKRRTVDRELPLPERSSLQLAQQLAASGTTPSEHLLRSELGHRVRSAVAKLSDPDREVLLMRNFEGLSNQEVAKVLAIEPATASKRYGRALLRLRTLLLDTSLSELG